MRAALMIVFVTPLAACGLLSGLDSLSVDGGAEDVTTFDVPDDVASDARVDGADGFDAFDGATTADIGPAEGSSPLACVHPADCFDGGAKDAAYPPDSGKVCCGTLVTSLSGPGCSLVSYTATCAQPAKCASDIPLISCGTDTVRGCQHASECTESSYPLCCIIKGGDASVQICINSTIASFESASCLDAGQ